MESPAGRQKVHKRPLKPAGPGKAENVLIIQGAGPRPPKPPEPELDPQIVKAIAAEAARKVLFGNPISRRVLSG